MRKIVFDAEVSDRKILWVPINTIATTPYNPPSRTKDGAKLRELAESVKEYGVIQPILITDDRDLVDGNRRLAAARMVGLEKIECLILPITVDRDKVFGVVNTTSEKINRSGWLYACHYGMRQPPPEVAAQYQELFDLIGAYGIDVMLENKQGLGLLSQCKALKAAGVPMRLGEIIMRVAKGRLTNKVNLVARDTELDHAARAEKLTELLQAEPA